MNASRPPHPAFDAIERNLTVDAISAELARYIATTAGEAPSVHNTQPWHFACDGKHFDVFADRTRQLKRIDPNGRLIGVSCGAAIHHAQLAIRGIGRASDLLLLPDQTNPDHLARLTIGAQDPASPTAGEWALLQSVGERRSYRGHFRRRLHPSVLDDLAAAVRAADCHFHRVESDGQRRQVERLIRGANAELEADAEYWTELATWRRAAETGPEGIPDTALGIDRMAAAGTPFPPRDFGLEDRPALASQVEPSNVTAPDVLAIWTQQDGPKDWVNAGRALAGLLLTATCAGAAGGLLDQPLEIPAARNRLRTALGVGGAVQLLLRIAYPLGELGENERTPRRPVSETLA